MEKKQLSSSDYLSYMKVRASLGDSPTNLLNEFVQILPNKFDNFRMNVDFTNWLNEEFTPRGGPIRKRILNNFYNKPDITKTPVPENVTGNQDSKPTHYPQDIDKTNKTWAQWPYQHDEL